MLMQEKIKKLFDEGVLNWREWDIRDRIDVAMLFAAVLLGIFFDWGIPEVIIFAIFVGIILRPISSRYLALPALFFLSFTPILLVLDREKRAEEFAVYAYYFLVMAVIRGIIEVRSEESGNKTIDD